MSDTLHSAAQAALDTVIDPWNGASLKPWLRTVTMDQGCLSAPSCNWATRAPVWRPKCCRRYRLRWPPCPVCRPFR